jgi:chromosome segregation ATPase
MRMRGLILGTCLAVAVGGTWGTCGRAEPSSKAAEPTALELGHQQVSLSFAIRDQAQKLEQLWQDPQFTSPEIAGLRKRLEALQQELLQVQIALRARVAELPAARAEAAKLAALKASYQAVSRKIEEKMTPPAP